MSSPTLIGAIYSRFTPWFQNGTIRAMSNTLFDALFAPHLQNDDVFLHLSGGQSLTYRRFLQRIGQFANQLQALGLNPGDRLAVQVEKSPEMLMLYGACMQAGVVFLPLNTAYKPAEISYFIKDSEAALFLCDGADFPALESDMIRFNTPVMTLNADGSGRFTDAAALLPTDFNTVARKADDLAALLYTSGTTGRSKGAMLSHKNLLSNAKALSRYWQFSKGDVLLHALPIFHTHGLFVATNIQLLTGGAMIFLPRFDTDAVLAALPAATIMMGVPTFYTRLLNDARFGHTLCAHMRLFISGSAPLLSATHKEFTNRTGHHILERYGMTETNMITSNPYLGERRAGAVGFALPDVEVMITDPGTGQELTRGKTGMIEVRGPNVFAGYWRMPEKTAGELRRDGFFITGDLGQIDADGYLAIVGRSKDLIISGGLNIYPKEIEQVLDRLEGVQESAVIGVPHPDFGEAVVAVVVTKKAVTLADSEISQAIAPHLAGFKQPKQIIIAESLPRNTMGKVQKNLLRDEHRDLFTDGEK